jgi:NAD(P)-dependent dehydrogenase (short-subunit alcohol dehydrogenase family)
MIMGLLEGRVAFVTGGAKNIGFAITERFCEEGAKVVIGDIDKEAGGKALDELNCKDFQVIFVHVDVTSEKGVEEALTKTLAAFGGVDILVNNAGIHFNNSVVDMDLKDWNHLLAINLTGAMLCSKVFARQMIKQGRGGRILFTSSQAGKHGYKYTSAYSASKFGMIGLMESLALELSEVNITVNGICPGNIDTEMLSKLVRRKAAMMGISEDAFQNQMIDEIPMRRLGQAREVADAFVFLASSMASYISGTTITIDGAELSG